MSEPLKAGRELDAVVNQIVRSRGPLKDYTPLFSTDPSACSLAKKWLRERCHAVQVKWWADIANSGRKFYAEARWGDDRAAWVFASTEEEAVSLLVLAVAEATKNG